MPEIDEINAADKWQLFMPSTPISTSVKGLINADVFDFGNQSPGVIFQGMHIISDAGIYMHEIGIAGLVEQIEAQIEKGNDFEALYGMLDGMSIYLTEDQIDVLESKIALKESKERGTTSFEDLRKELGL